MSVIVILYCALKPCALVSFIKDAKGVFPFTDPTSKPGVFRTENGPNRLIVQTARITRQGMMAAYRGAELVGLTGVRRLVSDESPRGFAVSPEVCYADQRADRHP